MDSQFVAAFFGLIIFCILFGVIVGGLEEYFVQRRCARAELTEPQPRWWRAEKEAAKGRLAAKQIMDERQNEE